jgi:hypothetical protein
MAPVSVIEDEPAIGRVKSSPLATSPPNMQVTRQLSHSLHKHLAIVIHCHPFSVDYVRPGASHGSQNQIPSFHDPKIPRLALIRVTMSMAQAAGNKGVAGTLLRCDTMGARHLDIQNLPAPR